MKTVPYYTNPKLEEYEAQVIRKQFDSELEWLDNSFPIARPDENETETYPITYANDGTNESYDLRPDDSVDSYCFFEHIDTELGDENDINTYRLAVVFWVSLEKMDSSNNEDFTTNLLSDVLRVLKLNDAGGITYDYDPFQNYDFEVTLLRRYTGFRIEFTIYGENNMCDYDVT